MRDQACELAIVPVYQGTASLNVTTSADFNVLVNCRSRN